jgi:hypothetical protein
LPTRSMPCLSWSSGSLLYCILPSHADSFLLWSRLYSSKRASIRRWSRTDVTGSNTDWVWRDSRKKSRFIIQNFRRWRLQPNSSKTEKNTFQLSTFHNANTKLKVLVVDHLKNLRVTLTYKWYVSTLVSTVHKLVGTNWRSRT